jgi:hypothetical protein
MSDFALAYILFWKLYQQAPQVFDLPLCIEECLIKLGSVGRKDILEYAASCVDFFQQPELESMFQNVLGEYSRSGD